MGGGLISCHRMEREKEFSRRRKRRLKIRSGRRSWKNRRTKTSVGNRRDMRK